MGWPFRNGTALGVAALMLLSIAAIAMLSHAAQGQLPVGYSEPGGYVFEERCAGCHGFGAEGTGDGPGLVAPAFARGTMDDKTLADAVAHRGEDSLTRQETADLVAFLRDLQREAGL